VTAILTDIAGAEAHRDERVAQEPKEECQAVVSSASPE
jgi:hypothetical protein